MLMGIIKPKGFLLCAQEGLWHIYKENNCTITCQRYNHDGTMESSLRMSEYVIADFSVDVDSKNIPHIFFYTDKGQLFLGCMKKEGWDIQPLSTFDPSKYAIFCPNLIIASNHIHLIFLLKNYRDNTHNILHQYWDNTQWRINKVTQPDSPVKSQAIINVKIDGNDNLHLTYNTGSIQGNYQLYYVKYNHRLNLWSSPVEVTNRMNNHFDWDMAIDHNNNANIAWIAKTDVHNICLRVFGNSADKEIFNGIVDSRPLPCSYVSLFQVNNNLNILWQESKNLRTKESKNMGKTWQQLYSPSLAGKVVYCFNLINPSLVDTHNIYYDKFIKVFGMLKDRLHIYRLCDLNPLFNDQSQRQEKDPAKNNYWAGIQKPIAFMKDDWADMDYQSQIMTWENNENLVDIDNYTTQELLQYIKDRINFLNKRQFAITQQLQKISDEMEKTDGKIRAWQHIVDTLQHEISILKEKTLLKRIIKLLKSH